MINPFQLSSPTWTLTARRILKRLESLGRFIVYQLAIQVVGLGCGILIVRSLPKDEYALVTMSTSFLSAMAAVADSGIPVAVMALGGRGWSDRDWLGGVLNAAFELRWRTGLISALIGVPVLLWMLHAHGASWPYAILIGGVILVIFCQNLYVGLLAVLPKLHGRLDQIQRLELAATASRATVLIAALPVGLNALVAMLSSLGYTSLQRLVYGRWRGDFASGEVPPTAEIRARTREIFYRALPQSVFFAVYSQVGVWLITLFGTTANLADLGALSRLATAMLLLDAVLRNFVVPHYAKLKDERWLGPMYLQLTVLYVLPFMALWALCALTPSVFLWVLGPKYSSLHRELILMGFSLMCGGLQSVTLALNLARGWVLSVWNSLGIGVLIQLVLISSMDLSTVTGVLWMTSILSLAGTVQNVWLASVHCKARR